MLTSRILSSVSRHLAASTLQRTRIPARLSPALSSHRLFNTQPRSRSRRTPKQPGNDLKPIFPRSVAIDAKSFGLEEGQIFAVQPNFWSKIFSPNTVFLISHKQNHLEQKTSVLVDKPKNRSLGAHHYRKTIEAKAEKRAFVQRDNYMTSHVDIVSTQTADTPGACLFVHFDKRRYLFGRLSEGTQRVINQRKYHGATLEQFFVTGKPSWSTVGGMMGMVMTLADTINSTRDAMQIQNEVRKSKGRKELDINLTEHLHVHGADNLSYLMATARSFIFRTGIPFKTIETVDDPRLEQEDLATPDIKDDCLNIWKLPIYPKSNKRRHDGTPASPASTKSEETSESREQRIRDKETLSAVVENMFNSDWRMDKLVPTMLHDVVLPAKIFQKGEDGVIRLYSGPKPSPTGDNIGIPNVEVLVREPWPSTRTSSLPAPSNSGQAMCYIAKNHDRRGKFLIEKANALKIPNTKFKILTAGNSIELEGKTITPDMVMEKSLPGQGFLVVDIPDASYLESFLARPELRNAEIMTGVSLVYWLLPPGLSTNPNIQRFMRENRHLKHIVCAADVSPNMMAFESHGCIVSALHSLDPARYNLLKFDNTVSAEVPTIVDAASPEQAKPLYTVGRVGWRAITMPRLQEKPENIVPFPDLLSRTAQISPEIFEAAAAAKKLTESPEFQAKVDADEADIPNRDAEIITLGTGSSVPSKYRNVSANLIRVPGVGNYLLDCGESTLGQMRRLFGNKETDDILANMRLIFISHLHADHHLGLATVLENWVSVTATLPNPPTLTLGCTEFMRQFLMEYAAACGLDLSRIVYSGLFANSRDYHDHFEPGHPSGLASAQYVSVNHCKDAHAGVFTWPSGLKISFSGDCRPSDNFAAIGRGSTVLIHECTFEDDKRSDAIAKKHSTMGEALSVASKMRAKRLILTHFSQRYAKLPATKSETIETEQSLEGLDADERERRVLDSKRIVLMGSDHMRIKIGEFQHAAEFAPAIMKYLQAVESEGDEVKEKEKELKSKELQEKKEKTVKKKCVKGKGEKKEEKVEEVEKTSEAPEVATGKENMIKEKKDDEMMK